MPSPLFRESTIESKMQFTICSALPLGSLILLEMSSMSSDFVMVGCISRKSFARWQKEWVNASELADRDQGKSNPYVGGSRTDWQGLFAGPREGVVADRELVPLAGVPGIEIDDIPPGHLPTLDPSTDGLLGDVRADRGLLRLVAAHRRGIHADVGWVQPADV